MDVLIRQVSGLQRPDLEPWIMLRLIRSDAIAGRAMFHEIDVARVRLIHQLHYDMQVNEEALPVVLALLDQLYDHRRKLRELRDALDRAAPEELKRTLVRHLADSPP